MDWTGAIEKTGDGLSVAWNILHFLVVIGFVLATLLLPQLGTYSIAKRRGIKHPWLAWLPIGVGYILGCITNQYQFMRFERQRGRRKLLLFLNCVYPVIAAGLVMSLVILLVCCIIGLFTIGLIFLSADIQKEIEMVFVLVMFFSLCGVPICVFRLQALYDLYRSCNPGATKVFLVLSIIFGVAELFSFSRAGTWMEECHWRSEFRSRLPLFRRSPRGSNP